MGAGGLIWGAWHYPLLLDGYVFHEWPLLGLVVFPVSTTLLSIVFGWLRQRSGSIWAPSLAHAASNAIGSSLTMLWFYGVANPLVVGYFGVLAWVPLGALCAWIVATHRLRSETWLRLTPRGAGCPPSSTRSIDAVVFHVTLTT